MVSEQSRDSIDSKSSGATELEDGQTGICRSCAGATLYIIGSLLLQFGLSVHHGTVNHFGTWLPATCCTKLRVLQGVSNTGKLSVML